MRAEIAMLSPFFIQAAVSPGRQQTFRSIVVAHLLVLAAVAWTVRRPLDTAPAPLIGHVLLAVTIVEGALLIGWRLTQLPKSQALEFLLVSPLRAGRVFVAEALVGITRLALVTLAGLPVLLLLALDGYVALVDVGPLLVMPLTWGVITGLGLAAWAYEPLGVRRAGERIIMALVVCYLLVGVLAGENLKRWVEWLPDDCGRWFLSAFAAMHTYNPFAVLQYALMEDPSDAWPRVVGFEAASLVLTAVLLLRAAFRLQPHFHERHYRPAVDDFRQDRGRIGTRPLSWWAVRRVTEYSGRVNLWLAGGFGLLYACYTALGPRWPTWLGSQVFVMFDRMGGIPTLATALVVLAAVPAAFQYGLWDSNTQDRCRRLELLLLTNLGARDYWEAAAAAAWRRGRGYFAVALLLWGAGLFAGRITVLQMSAALAAGMVLWGLYFSLGFRAFARGVQASALGLFLTLGLPLLSLGASRTGWGAVAALVPPGSVYMPGVTEPDMAWLPGPLLAGLAALALAQVSFSRCDRELRNWYDQHHGRKVMD
jgi:hypothetical protein